MTQSNKQTSSAAPTPQLLLKLSDERLLDAEKLLSVNQYQSVVYLCGYAVETAIKAKICKHLRWPSYKLDVRGLKSHDLPALLDFTGIQDQVIRTPDWSYIYSTVKWSSEMRYQDPADFDQSKAEQTLEAAKNLVRILCA